MNPYTYETLSKRLVTINGNEISSYYPKTYEAFDCSSVNGDHKSPNPHSFFRVKFRYPHGLYRVYDDNNTLTYMVEGQTDGLSAWGRDEHHLPSRKDEAYNHAVSQLYSKIKSTDLQLYADIAEASETKALLFTLKGKINAVQELLGKAKLLKKIKIGSSAYLAIIFGLMPIIETLNGLINLLNTNTFKSKKIEAKFTVVENLSEQRPGLWSKNYDHLASRSDRCKIEVYYTLGDLQTVIKNQTGLQILPSLMWETIPLSFIIDWFINIGGFLNNFEMASGSSGYKFVNGFVTHTTKSSFEESADFTVTLPWGGFIQEKEQMSGQFISKERYVLSSFPYPTKVLTNFDDPLNGNKLLSLASMLIQKL